MAIEESYKISNTGKTMKYYGILDNDMINSTKEDQACS